MRLLRAACLVALVSLAMLVSFTAGWRAHDRFVPPDIRNVPVMVPEHRYLTLAGR